MHERPVIFKNGLISPTSLLEFMDDCHCDDPEAVSPLPTHKSEYHHLYFPKKSYKNNFTDLSIRRLRNSKYNLIEMLSCQEDFYHQTVARSVPQDEISLEAAETYLEESEWLTNYAASSWMIAETQNAIERPYLPRVARAVLTARLALLNEMRQQDVERVRAIELIEPEIVLGALGKYVIQRPENELEKFIESGLSLGTQMLPTKIYGEVGLKVSVESRLDERIRTGSWLTQRLCVVPLVAEAA